MSKFSFIFFVTPPIKLELDYIYVGTTTDSKPHGPIIMIDQLEILSYN